MQSRVFTIGNLPQEIEEQIDWIIKSQEYASIWQTIFWNMMLKSSHYEMDGFFVGIFQDEKLLAYSVVEKRTIGLGQCGLFVVGGPVFMDISALELLSDELKKLTKQEKALFVQCEPLEECELSGFKKSSYKRFIEPYTALIDLNQSEEDILARMKQKGRYNIKLAQKHEVSVESVPFTEDNLDIFYSLLSETTDRDGFAGNSKEYYRWMLEMLTRKNVGGLYFASKEGEVIAAGIFVFYASTAIYYYGASTSDNTKRKYMATYLLQWQAILDAKKKGCRVYDFLGIAPPGAEDSHLAGVTDFKLKLSDNVKKWPESRIYIHDATVYFLFRLAKKVKNFLK